MSAVSLAVPARSVPEPSRVSAPSVQRRPKGRAPLRVVDGTKGHLRQALVPVLSAAIILFLATVVLPLILNTAMASLSYEIRDQRIETAQTQARIESLEARLLMLDSTDYLRSEAESIGLVPAGSIGVISLEDGTVEGGTAADG